MLSRMWLKQGMRIRLIHCDPLNTPYRPDITKEQILDLMVDKMIRKGEKLTPEIKKLLETQAKKPVEEGNKRQNEKKDGNDRDNDSEENEWWHTRWQMPLTCHLCQIGNFQARYKEMANDDNAPIIIYT